MSKPRPLSLKLLFTAAVLCAVLVSAELAARVFQPDPPSFRIAGTEHFDLRYDPELGWVNPPGSVEMSFEYGGGSIYTNDLGFRDGDVLPDKPPGAFRILALGDSFTWGWAVADGQRFSDILEARLNALGDKDYDVINAGVTGYSTDQELLLLQRNVDRLSPDAVVLFYYENDCEGNGLSRFCGAEKPLFIGGENLLTLANVPCPVPLSQNSDPTVLRPKSSLMGSALYRVLLYRSSTNEPLAGLLALAGLWNEEETNEVKHEKCAEITKSILNRLADECKSRGLPLLVLFMPKPEALSREKYDSEDFETPVRPLMRFTAGLGVQTISLYDKFRELDLTSGRVCLTQNEHLNVLGHELTAGFIYQALESGKVILAD
jgi:GDSL-like Lipase/Acylhydrolase family